MKTRKTQEERIGGDGGEKEGRATGLERRGQQHVQKKECRGRRRDGGGDEQRQRQAKGNAGAEQGTEVEWK